MSAKGGSLLHQRRMKRWIALASIGTLIAVYLFVLSPRVSVGSDKGFVSISNTLVGEQQKAPTVIGKASVALEPSGSIVEKGYIRLRFDYFLDPSDLGYSIHHVYVVDETSKEFLAGYTGKLDADGNPVDIVGYQKWFDGLPHIWRNNPFVCVFVYVEDETDAQIQTLETDILNSAYQYWNATHDMRNFHYDNSSKVVKTLTPLKTQEYQTRLASIVTNKGSFSVAP